MRKSKTSMDTLQTLAMVATIISALVLIFATFFPQLITNVTKQAIDFDDQYRESDGDVRPAVVPAQINAFIIASTIIIVLAGLFLTLYFHIGIKSNASFVALGKGKRKWHLILILILFAVIFLTLGINLPRAIFNPTHERTLAIYFNLGAWAKNSILGGCILGVIGLFLSGVVALIAYYLFVWLPQIFKKKKLEKKFH